MLTPLIILCLALAGLLAWVLLQNRRPAQEDPIFPMIQKELAATRQENSSQARMDREEQARALKSGMDVLKSQLDTFSKQITQLTQSNESRLEQMRVTMETRLDALRAENSAKLEQMRATVDEKLHATLEKRLGESFKLVSDRLEIVHRGLGEMQSLATGVGDLKKVLTNVKTRGTWGEIQLGNLLEQILTPDQYAKNVITKMGSSEPVEYAIRLPGNKDVPDKPVWLPIDAKFPQEAYLRLLEAQEAANPELVESASKELEKTLKEEAKKIKTKYLDPPNTTEYAIMYLPTESLYAEALRRVGLAEILQREYRVNVAGPMNLAALLNSLQMGFRTLIIEKRSSEVWGLLGAVKTEFGRFGEILEKTQKKLQEASSTIDAAASKSRTIERKLAKVQEMPQTDALKLLEKAAENTETEPVTEDLPF